MIDPAKLRELHDKATPGPWGYTVRDYGHAGIQHDIDGDEWSSFASVWVRQMGENEDSEMGLANAELMRMSRDLATAHLAALDRIAALEARETEPERVIDRALNGLWDDEDLVAARAWLAGKAGA